MNARVTANRPAGGSAGRKMLSLLGGMLAVLIGILVACGAARPGVGGAQLARVALRGTVVTPESVMPDAVVTIAGGAIEEVAPVAEAGAEPHAIDVGGLILPGLIDLHDHLTWNVLPRWKVSRTFSDRDEWHRSAEYQELIARPHDALERLGYGCDMNRYAEVKAIVNGATSVVGGGGVYDCVKGLARNLESFSDFEPPHAVQPGSLRSVVDPLARTSSCDQEALRRVGQPALTCAGAWFSRNPQPVLAAVVHLAEGASENARREFEQFDRRGFLVKGVSIVHGVALEPDNFRAMATRRVGLVWSPRSNMALYGRTADVRTAKASGVALAIAPDWSVTGSTGMLPELAYAARLAATPAAGALTDRELVEMATVNAARLGGLSERIGRVAPGAAADLLVLAKPSIDDTAAGRSTSDVYRTIVSARPTDVRLVMVGGRPLFGDAALMRRLAAPDELDPVAVCGETRMLHVREGAYARVPWHTTVARLSDRLALQHAALAPLVECP